MESDYPTRAQKAKISGEIYLPSIWFNGDCVKKFVGRWSYTLVFGRRSSDGDDHGHKATVTLKKEEKRIKFELRTSSLSTFGTSFLNDDNKYFDQFPREWRLAVIANIMEDHLGLTFCGSGIDPIVEYKPCPNQREILEKGNSKK